MKLGQSKFFCSYGLLFTTGFFLLTSIAVVSQGGADLWLIVASAENGAVTLQTTRKDLVRLYGAPNVVDQEVDIGDGEMQSATFLFRNDPERKIEILWKDPDTKTAPQSADISGRKSRWHTTHGITLGTSVSQLERINGRSFRFVLTNDGTDMAEETISWRGGLLQKEFQGKGRIILEIESSPSEAAKQKGPHDFAVDSDSPVWRAEKPHISRMSWIFPR